MSITLLKGIPKLAKKGWKKRKPGASPEWIKKGTPARKAKAAALREHRSSKSHKAYKKLIKSIPHDLTYLKGQK
jgi:hypothetical protein